MITMQEILERRTDSVQDLGFYQGKFFNCSLIGEIEDLDGEYLDPKETAYPCFGMSVMVIGVKAQLVEMGVLIEKIALGKPWNLVQWVVDTGRMNEIVCHGHRWNEYGVNFDVRFGDITGNQFYQELRIKYFEALKND